MTEQELAALRAANKVLVTRDDGDPGGYALEPVVQTLHVVDPLKSHASPDGVRSGIAAVIRQRTRSNINADSRAVVVNEYTVADAVLSYLVSVGWGPKEGGRRVRHVKRGSTYRVIGEAEAQVSTGVADAYITATDVPDAPEVVRFVRSIGDGDRLTVYQCEADGKLWARFTDEFGDGRFEDLTPEPRS